MVDFSEDVANLNFLSPNKIKVIINKFPNVQFFAQSFNVPGMTIGYPKEELIGLWIIGIGDKEEYNSLLISFIVDEDLVSISEIKNWMYEVITIKETKSLAFSDLSILLLDNQSNVNRTVKIHNSFPFAIDDIQMSVKLDENEPLLMTVGFKFSHWTLLPTPGIL